jgi:urea transport system ATP-binding protein
MSALGDAAAPGGLVLEDLSLRFGGLEVLSGLSLSVPRGELRCIIGPNGAGKTTLFNLIAGTLRPHRGRVVFEGVDITRLPTYERARRGIVRKFQVPSVYAHATVAENVRIAAAGSQNPFSLIRRRGQAARQEAIEHALSTTGLINMRAVPASVLSHGEKQWLEIAMVLAARPKLMLLDEPTAGMTPTETRQTAHLIREIADDVTTIVI